MGFCRATRIAPLLLVVALAACKEDQAGVVVKDLSFSGNAAVSTVQLKSVLATAESARLPWGQREYFTREEFDAQSAVLLRTREKLEHLQEQVTKLEKE